MASAELRLLDDDRAAPAASARPRPRPAPCFRRARARPEPAPARRPLASTCSSSVRPASGCSTLGRALRIRVPLPAARTVTHRGVGHAGGLLRWASRPVRPAATLAISPTRSTRSLIRCPNIAVPLCSISTARWSRPRPTSTRCWPRCWPRRACRHPSCAAVRAMIGDGARRADRAGVGGHRSAGRLAPPSTGSIGASVIAMSRCRAGYSVPYHGAPRSARRSAGRRLEARPVHQQAARGHPGSAAGAGSR